MTYDNPTLADIDKAISECRRELEAAALVAEGCPRRRPIGVRWG